MKAFQFYYSLIDWHHPECTTDRFHPQREDPARRVGDKNWDMKKYAQLIDDGSEVKMERSSGE